MATRIDQPVAFSETELETLLDALSTAAQNYDNTRSKQPAIRTYSQKKADEFRRLRGEIFKRRYHWTN